MAKVDIPYSVIHELYPQYEAAVIARLRRGKSIHKNAQPQDLEWYYDWAYRGESYTLSALAERLSIAQSRTALKTQTKDKFIQSQCDRTLVNVYAQKGRWWGFAEGMPPITPIPPEIQAYYYKQWDDKYQARKSLIPATCPECLQDGWLRACETQYVCRQCNIVY